ncbi:oligosaccharide flippase family protein [Thioclava kandeliae]|uniref:Oligosaccharide flippase family protein n=1 Tax=Thioclava kandeliae TaxID=3070818 RepID=A0ABV1SIZ8_9RHOB
MSKGLWSLVLQMSRLGGNVVFFLAMARLLPVADLGAFATGLALFRWMQVVHKGGIADAVVLTAPGDMRRMDALFWLAQLMTLGICLLALGLMVLAAWGIGALEGMGPVIATLMLVPLFQGLSAVQEAQLRQALRLKALACRTAFVQLVSALGGFALYALGAGLWSLVGFAVLNAALSAVLSWRMARWWPQAGPDRGAIRAIAPEVFAIAGRGLVAGAALPLLQLALGLVYGGAVAGGFQIAQRIFQLLDAVTLAPIRFLVLPMLWRAKGQGPALVRRVIGAAASLSAPFYVMAALWAQPVLVWLLGRPAGEIAAPMVQIMAALGPVASLVLALDQALVAQKSAGRALWRACLTLAFTVVFVALALPVSAYAGIGSYVLAAYLALAVTLGRSLRLIGVRPQDVARALALPYILSAGLGVCLWRLGTLVAEWPLLWQLMGQGALMLVACLPFWAVVLRRSRGRSMPPHA